jgi:hypothetical protein
MIQEAHVIYALNFMARERSKYVVIAEIPRTDTNSRVFHYKCVLCGAINKFHLSTLSVDIENNDLQSLHKFCYKHAHVDHVQSDFNKFIDNDEPEKDEVNVPSNDSTEFILNGSLYTSGGKAVVAISSDSLKWIARLSDFNVDLQCRNGIIPSYRAICGKCKEHMELNRETVHDISVGRTDTFPEFVKFLVAHRHTVEVEPVGGRKFRNVSIP